MIQRIFYKNLHDRLQTSLNFLQILLGPRQVGKTTAIQHIVERWTGGKLFISADGPVAPDHHWLRTQWRRALDLPRPTLFVIDEIQKVQNWSGVVKELYDQVRSDNDFRIVLLGSASLSIQQGLNDSLAGRYELIKATHWTFGECKEAFSWDLKTYLKFGGYPAPAEFVHDLDRWQSFMLESIVEPVLGRDLQGVATIHKPALFRQVFELAMNLPSQEISYQKMLGQLQEGGNASTIKHYLEILSGAFLLRVLEKYTQRPVVRKSSSPKILPLAPALIHAFRSPWHVDDDPEWRGRIFECVVGAKLAQKKGKLFYWREGNAEIDFVYVENAKVYAIEVKSGRKRNFNGLSEFCRLFPEAIPVVVDWESGAEWLKCF